MLSPARDRRRDRTFVSSQARLTIAAALSTLALCACGDRTGLGATAPPTTADAATPCTGRDPNERSYLFDAVGALYSYDPDAQRTVNLGVPDCHNANVPWTMTVARESAYIVYTDWSLYKVDLKSLACTRTPFVAGQLGLDAEFGVAVSITDADEKLYVYGQPPGASTAILAVGDLSSFVLKKVADIHPTPPVASFPVNLSSDGAGNLYAFSPGGLVQQIDAANGTVVRSVQTGVTTSSTWAGLTHGGALVLVVESHAHGFDLVSQTETFDRDLGIFAIGAGTIPACQGR